jgi:hypothetical protein
MLQIRKYKRGKPAGQDSCSALPVKVHETQRDVMNLQYTDQTPVGEGKKCLYYLQSVTIRVSL